MNEPRPIMAILADHDQWARQRAAAADQEAWHRSDVQGIDLLNELVLAVRAERADVKAAEADAAPPTPPSVARYYVVIDRALGDDDHSGFSGYQGGHDGTAKAAIAMLEDELVELAAGAGVVGSLAVVGRELLAVPFENKPSMPPTGWPLEDDRYDDPEAPTEAAAEPPADELDPTEWVLLLVDEFPVMAALDTYDSAPERAELFARAARASLRGERVRIEHLVAAPNATVTDIATWGLLGEAPGDRVVRRSEVQA